MRGNRLPRSNGNKSPRLCRTCALASLSLILVICTPEATWMARGARPLAFFKGIFPECFVNYSELSGFQATALRNARESGP